jgi:hypothetical protein
MVRVHFRKCWRWGKIIVLNNVTVIQRGKNLPQDLDCSFKLCTSKCTHENEVDSIIDTSQIARLMSLRGRMQHQNKINLK